MSRSLTNRIFLATALTAVVSIGLAISVVNVAVTQRAEDQLQSSLEDSARLVEHYSDILFDQFAREAQLIADLPKLKAAVGVDHAPTMQPIAEDYHAEIGSDIFVVTNAKGRLLALVGPVDIPTDRLPQFPPIKSALSGRAVAAFWPRHGGDVQVVTIPIWIDERRPELLGTLSVGFSLDKRLASQFQQLTASDIAFVVDGAVQASTLPAAYDDELAAAVGHLQDGPIRLGDEEYVAVTRPLSNPAELTRVDATQATGDAPPPPMAVILRSRTKELEFLGALQTRLAATGVFVILIATLVSYGVAKTVTRPVGAIIATMREMSDTGDLTTKIDLPGHPRWHDEDTMLLANTFNTMTDSIARFQREIGERERLSSLGRLSTVVAHEIRNPLMIIKAALRTLGRQPGLSEPARTAVQDIHEEVDRLNRLVGEVLDFARPIRFELEPVDLNALCTDAVAAAVADGEGPPIRATLDPAVGQLVTDVERIRLTLVNVLTNARQAVRERERDSLTEELSDRPAPSSDAVTLTTRADRESVRICVHDRGTGIAPEDLPHVFDPFFTTRRTGSGLGLAIAKNVIDGLGGRITVTSQFGGGTNMQIDLPRRATSDGATP